MTNNDPWISQARGVAFVLMICQHWYHFALGYYYNIQMPWWADAAGVCSRTLFLLLVGMGLRRSARMKRSATIALAAVAVTAFTRWLHGEEGTVVFGILHCIAAARLLWALVGRALTPRGIALLALGSKVVHEVMSTHVVTDNVVIHALFGAPMRPFYLVECFPLCRELPLILLGVLVGSPSHTPSEGQRKPLSLLLVSLGQWSLPLYLVQFVCFHTMYARLSTCPNPY